MTTPQIAIADRRRRALIQKWVNDPLWTLVQVENAEMLHGKIHDLSGYTEASTGRLAPHRARSVIMIEGSRDRDQTWSVWVRAGFTNYRCAYRAFVQHAYGIANVDNAWVGYQIDHLSNKAHAPTGDEFIRIEAIPEFANQRWGVNFESRRTQNTYGRPSHRLSYMSCAKLAGLPPPTGPQDTAGINLLVDFFKSLGLDPQTAQDGVANMLLHAYWRR